MEDDLFIFICFNQLMHVYVKIFRQFQELCGLIYWKTISTMACWRIECTKRERS